MGGTSLVLTHDIIAEGVHFLPDDPPGDVAWKLVAVNLSDLAAKGARPVGVLLGYALGDDDWDRAFADGLGDGARRVRRAPARRRHGDGAAGARADRDRRGDRAGAVAQRRAGRATISGSAARSAMPGPGLKMLQGELAATRP